MKKILFVISRIQKLGGSERVTISLANELSKDYKITIISRDDNKQNNAYPLNSAVTDIKVSGSNLKFINYVKRYVKKETPYKIIFHTMSKLTPIFLLSGIRSEYIWSFEHISFESHSRLFKFLRKLLYKRLERILVFTESEKEIFLSMNENVEVIRNPSPFPIIDSSKSYKIDSKNIISIGSLEHRKGFDMLIDAWSILGDKYPDWSLLIYGEGKDKDILINKITQSKLNNVHLMGKTVDPCNVYDNSAFYVMTSRYEGLPMVLIEAQSRGLPIVSFDCPTGPREIITHNLDGYLVDKNNTNKLSQYIEKLILNSDTRIQMSENAKISAERFMISKISNHWKSLIN